MGLKHCAVVKIWVDSTTDCPTVCFQKFILALLSNHSTVFYLEFHLISLIFKRYFRLNKFQTNIGIGTFK